MSTEPIVRLTDVTKRFGQVVAVDSVSFEVYRGHIVSLLGPSGCGKTTTLRLIAGFEVPDGGGIEIDGRNMGGLRPYERNVGLLFQDYALFPHMTVQENVAFGLRHRGFERRSIPDRVEAMLEMVKLTGYEARRPSELSGGQQQRVALARALATEPAVMLLDEPLSALDAKLRQELRIELREILNAADTTTIVVTHDQEEAMSLAEHVIVMEEGRIMQRGTPEEVYSTPANKFVAEFIGRSNWFGGVLGTAESNGLHMFGPEDAASFRVPSPGAQDGAGYEVCVRPERILLSKAQPTNDRAVNCLPVKVVDVAYLGADLHMFVETEQGKRISAIEKNAGGVGHREGEAVFACFRPEDCILVPVARRAGEE